MSQKSKLALYLDDIRIPIEELPNFEWAVVTSYTEFTEFIIKHYKQHKKLPELISFDHDLADEHIDFYFNNPKYSPIRYEEFKEKTGLHCAKWLTALCDKNEIDLRNSMLSVHSHNPIGANNIQQWLNFYLMKKYGKEYAACYIQKFKHTTRNGN